MKRRKAAALLVNDAWKLYQVAILASSKKKSQIIEEGRWGNYIEPVIGNKKISELTKYDYLILRRYIENQGLSPQTVYHCLSLLRRILFNIGDFHNENIPFPSFKDVMPRFDNRRVRYLDYDEALLLLNTLKQLDDSGNWHTISLFALNTGIRRGELFNLTLSNINFTDRYMTIVDTKTSKNRIIPINNIAYAILCKKNTITNKYEKIFIDKNPKIFRKAIEKTGLNEGITDQRNKIVFHTFRHTFASWIVQMGTPLPVVSQLLGHSNLQMTMRYAHLSPSQTHAAVNIISEKLNKLNIV